MLGRQANVIGSVGVSNDYQTYKSKNGAHVIAPNDNRYHLMEFTGLTDRNGKEIYESDLFLVEHGGFRNG